MRTLNMSRLFIDFSPWSFYIDTLIPLNKLFYCTQKIMKSMILVILVIMTYFFHTFLSALISFIKMQFFTLWNSSPNKNGHYLKLQFIKKVQGQTFQFSIWLIFVFMENILLWLVVVKRSKYMIKWFLIQPFLEG